MKRRVLRSLVILGAAAALAVASATAAVAQLPIDPTATPARNTGGWVYNMAQLVTILGAVILVFIVGAYMRFAPRFQREETARTIRAERIRPGQDPPRRAVDLSQAVPVVVAPPAVPQAVPAAVAAPVAPPVAPAAAPAAPAQAPTPAAPAPAAPLSPAPAPAPAEPREKHEVSLDQETFDKTLAELLEKGTERRVAEGQARRAAMIAARKKAGA